MVVMYCIRNWTTASPQLLKHLRCLQTICSARCLLLDPEYIPSKDNTVPDQLSRIKGDEDFQLAPDIFRQISERFGRRTWDRFASRSNTLCNRFNSRHHDVGSSGVDAFLQDWRGERNWANPPWSLLPRLTAFLAARPEVEAVVLAPDWPSALWFPRLRRMANGEMKIKCRPGMFRPGDPSKQAILPAPRWDLRAFHLRPHPLPRNRVRFPHPHRSGALPPVIPSR